jgi:hypothetical protein
VADAYLHGKPGTSCRARGLGNPILENSTLVASDKAVKDDARASLAFSACLVADSAAFAAPRQLDADLRADPCARVAAHRGSQRIQFVTDARSHHLDTHGLPGILMGFRLADDNLHAPNMKYNLTLFLGGTISCACPCEELAKSA